ncbi:MAG: hypothetical protein KDK36_12735, partial [Leptospiraceae bacterium]|nr:hypothetical protein [Leptospiraceae bacterium]
PPKRKGFYAFPKGFVEYFLITNREPQHITQKSVWLKNEKGEKFKEEGNYKPFEYTRGNKIFYNHWVSKEVLKQLKRKGFKKNWVEKDFTPQGDWYLCYFKPPKGFRHFGNVWNHLHTFEGFPIELRRRNWIKGSWIKLSYRNYCYAFHKVTKTLKEKLWKENHKEENFDYKEYLCWNKSKWKENFEKDDFEVFIEKRRG